MSISNPLSLLSSFKHFHISVQATTMILEFHFPFFLNLFSFSRLLFFLSTLFSFLVHFSKLQNMLQNFSFFCATLLYGVFFNIFWKSVIFFWYFNGPKKIRESFFSQNQNFSGQIVFQWFLRFQLNSVY